MRRRPLEEIEAEIRATRGRITALLAQSDRRFGLRAGLDGLRRLAAKPNETAGAEPELLRRLALPAALLAFVAGLVGARRAEKPDHCDKV